MMERPRIIWLILLTAAVFVYWLPVPKTATRIEINPDSNAIPASSYLPYDRYFIHINYFPEIFIPSAKTPPT